MRGCAACCATTRHHRPERFAATAITTLQQLAESSTPQDNEQPSTSGIHDHAAEIMYIWALAETYCTHPMLQESMRCVLHWQPC